MVSLISGGMAQDLLFPSSPPAEVWRNPLWRRSTGMNPSHRSLQSRSPRFQMFFLVIYLYNVISTIFFFWFDHTEKPFPDAHTLLFPVFQDDLLRYLKDIFCKQQVEFIQFPFADMAIGGTLWRMWCCACAAPLSIALCSAGEIFSGGGNFSTGVNFSGDSPMFESGV